MDYDEYDFWLDAYTPDTIPMERLAKYMGALAKLFGHGASVHFSRLDTGSTVNVLRVEKEDASQVFDRIARIASCEAANDALAAYDELNCLLRDDNAVGRLSRMMAGAPTPVPVLHFQGRDLPKQPTFGPFNEVAVVEGELVRIGGRDKSAHAQLVDLEGKPWSGEMSRELAREMAPYLYKGNVLRVTGDAKWERLADGTWRLLGFKVHSFEVLADDTLEEAAQRLRNLHKTDWDSVDDVATFIAASRGGSDGLH